VRSGPQGPRFLARPQGTMQGVRCCRDIVAPEPEPAVVLDPPSDDYIGISLPPGMEVDEEDVHALVPPARPTPATADTPSRGRSPPEPWYYGFLVGTQSLCMVIGVCQFGYVLIVTLDALSKATSGMSHRAHP